MTGFVPVSNPSGGDFPLADIRTIDVEKWLKTLRFTDGRKKGEVPAPGTKKKIRDVMHVLFTHAARYEWTHRNPISFVRQSGKRQEVPQLLMLEQLGQLIFGLELRERVMVFLDFGGGLRREELAGLKWLDFDFIRSQLTVRRSVLRQHVGKTKTEASTKPIPIDEYLMDDLMRWWRETMCAMDEDFVFASAPKKGKQPYWLSRIMQHHIKPAAAKLGIQLKGWHTLRHTYSTLLKRNNNDPKVVQELLRHASFLLTMDGYTQAVANDKRRAHSELI